MQNDPDASDLHDAIVTALRAEADALDVEGAHADAAEMRLFADAWEARGMPATWPDKHAIRH